MKSRILQQDPLLKQNYIEIGILIYVEYVGSHEALKHYLLHFNYNCFVLSSFITYEFSFRLKGLLFNFFTMLLTSSLS